MEPRHLIGQPVYTDDHSGRHAGLFQQPAPLRDSLTIGGEDDGLRRVRWKVHRNLPSTAVLEHPGNKLSRACAGGLGARCAGPSQPAVFLMECLLLHALPPFIVSSEELGNGGLADLRTARSPFPIQVRHVPGYNRETLMSLTPGTRLGPYEILAIIGAGGMGEVYRARDGRLKREVAVKILPLAAATDASRRQRFEFEARTVAALNHPNIVAIYDVGAEDGVS